MTGSLEADGFLHLPYADETAYWARSALKVALQVLEQEGDLRHGKTWRVGVDELPNQIDGSIAGVPLRGAWGDYVLTPDHWHRAQLSVVYPGYPLQDRGETLANHRYRLNRDAAHVDGLLPEGPEKRRHLREPHGFILGLPLNTATASPLVVWRGSHLIMQRAFKTALSGVEPKQYGDIDLTESYIAARKKVFDKCARVELRAKPGEATLLHRHLLHGVAPWGNSADQAEGRIIAYFRPLTTPDKWLE